jgi:hypothetical protein
MADRYDGTIKIDTRIDEGGVNKGMKSITGTIAKAGMAIGAAFSAVALVNFGKEAVRIAGDIQEMTSKFNVVFRNFARQVEQELGVFAEATNQSKYALMGFAAQIQDTFVPLGFARDQASRMSVEVVKLATDLSSFSNVPVAEVMRDIQSAIVGNTETVRKYGVVITQAMLEQAALNNGLWNGVGAMTAQAKAATILQMITEGNADAQGDATRTAGSFANQIRGISNAMLDLRIAVGNAIIPIASQFLPYIKAAIQAIAALFAQLAGIINILLGTNIAASQTAGAMGGVADATGDAADAQGDLADKTKAAGKAAKGALAAFDQLNVLQQPDTGGAGGDVGAGVPGGGVGDFGFGDLGADGGVMDTLAEKAEKVRVFLQPLTDAFGRLREALIPLGQTIWAGLVWAWDNILVPLGTWVISNLLPAFLDLLAQALTNLDTAIIALQPMALWLWDNVLKPAAEWTGAAIIDALEWITERLKDLNTWIGENQTAFQVIAAIILIVIAIMIMLANPIIAVIALIALVIAIIVNWGAIWEWIVEKITYAWEVIKMIWGIVAWWFKTQVFEPMADVAAWALNKISDKFRDIFTGIESFVKGSINRIIDFINGMIRGVADGINAVIIGANSIGQNLPGYAMMSTIAVPQIPRLATGAVIPPNSEFLAILGDQRSGRNIEAPENLIRQIIREEMGGMQTNVKIDFVGSLAALARELKPEIDIENTRVGGSLVTGAIA